MLVKAVSFALLTLFALILNSSGVTAQDPVKIAFVYRGGGFANVSDAAQDFADLLSIETGIQIEASVYHCEKTILDHMGAGLIDLAHLSSVAYVIGHDLYGIEAQLATNRFGYPYYRSQINVPAAAGYTDIMDLQNKRFAFANEASTSGYMVPYLLIRDLTGMSPEDFFSEIYFAGDHPSVIIDVYEGNADGGASYWDARDAVESTYPDVKTVVSVLAYSDDIPNGPWAFRSGLDPTTVQTLSDGIIAVANTVEGDTAIETIFNSSFIGGFEAVDDSSYDFLREVVEYFALVNLVLETCFEIYLPVVLK